MVKPNKAIKQFIVEEPAGKVVVFYAQGKPAVAITNEPKSSSIYKLLASRNTLYKHVVFLGWEDEEFLQEVISVLEAEGNVFEKIERRSL